jgi:superfamily II DNA/RNA helicase
VQGKAGDNNTSGVGPPQQQQQQQQHTDGEEGKKGAQQVQHKPGTGRTLAWLLPALVHVHQQLQQEQQQLGGRAAASSITTAAAASSSSSSSRAGVAEPSVLVVTPSRELVQQVASVYKQLQADTRFGSAAACSGVDQQAQQQMLQHRRTLLLVATPGRLLAMLSRSSSMAGGQQQQQQQQGWLSLARVQLLVLDNEDRMGSMSSWAQLERFVAHLPRLGQPAASGMVAADAAGCDAADQPEKRRVRKTQHWLR